MNLGIYWLCDIYHSWELGSILAQANFREGNSPKDFVRTTITLLFPLNAITLPLAMASHMKEGRTEEKNHLV